ncbi:MAG TPA: tetratricopeptide repeat protein [bacterium]
MRRRLWGVLVAALVASAPLPAPAVVTHDLLQDTPRTRDLLREETSASALAPRESAAVPKAAASARGDFETIWFAREKYLQIGEADRAEEQLGLLVATAAERGVRNLPEYGTVLVREASRRMRTGDWAQAAKALGWARRLAPDELTVYTTGALLALRRNPINVVPIIDELRGAARAIGRSFRLQVWLRENLLGTAVAGLSFFFAFSLLVAAVVAAPSLVHDLREATVFGTPRLRAFFAWGVLALPVLLGLSPWWWVIVAALLLWPYFPTPARVLVVLGALFLLALPVLTRERAVLLTTSERPVLGAVVQVREGNWTAADHAVLKAEAERGSAGVPTVTALALAARHLGNLDDAEAALRAGLQVAPGDASLWNNLGTVAFARQDLAGAIADFSKAAELAPGLFAPHRNLAVSYRESFKFAEGEAEARRSGELDPDAAAFYAGLDAARVKGATADALPALPALWKMARTRGDEEEAAVDHVWGALMLGAPIHVWPAVVIALALASAGLGFWRLRRTPAGECQRCGKLFCPRCQPGRRGELCSQCHHIFVKKEGVDARVRVQKMGEIKAWRRRVRVRHLVCAALAPGGGHLSAGRFRAGLLFLLPASFLEARPLFGGGYPSPWSLAGPAAAWASGVGIGLFVVLWALSLWLTFRMEE